MTPNEKPTPAGAGEAETDQAKRAAKRQASDAPSNNDKVDEGLRPDQLTTENDGGAEG